MRTQKAAETRIAVFAQTDFPRYGTSALLVPSQIADDLRAIGFPTDLLDGETLAQPGKFIANRYAAVILPYGNTYPLDAFENLRRFHRAGGSLVTTGIPFTHAAARRSARDWQGSPQWGGNVQLVAGAGPRAGTNAFRIIGETSGWNGVSSARFPVRPGDRVEIAGFFRDMTPPNVRLRDMEGRKDAYYVRFFDAGGEFIRQDGVILTSVGAEWKRESATVVAPANAARADLSVQLQRPGRRTLAADFSATVNGTPVRIPNADLTQFGIAYLDLGHSDDTALWGPEGIGIGGFAGPQGKVAPFVISRGDPFRLKGVITEVREPQPAPQWINPASLPKGVRVIPAVGEPSRPLAGLIVHEAGAYKGAVDAWTYRTFGGGDREDFENRQLVVRGTLAALGQRGVLSRAQQTAAFRKLDARPRPPVYANLTLPKIPRQYETFQPKMPPPAQQLLVADIRKLSSDEKLLFISLQGIVNRKQPRIYYLFDSDDQLWLDELQKQGATGTPAVVADPFSLFETFRAEYRGAVLPDPKVYASACVAVSLAGADDLLVTKTPELAARVNVPIQADLRGKFKDNPAALRHIHTDLLPRLDPYLTCSLDPAVYDRGGLDSIIAARGSTFWITGPKAQNLPGANQPGEMEEVRTLFTKMPLGAVVRGFWWHGDDVGLQESDGVALGSRFGKVTLVSDLITNLSVHSGVRVERLTQKPRKPAPTLDPSKVYICFTMSDGDNLCTWRGYFRRYYEDPVRGSFPIGWGMGPALLDLAPTWAKWYYENATENDEFICDVSGVAYIYPPSWATTLKDRDGAFKHFYGQTQDYMARMDMRTIRLMDVTASDIARVGKLLPNVEYLLPDYGHAGPERYPELTYTLPTGQPVFRAATNGSGPENFASQIRKRSAGARPAFLNVFVWNWGSKLADLKKTLEILGPEYVAVTPSQLHELYVKANGRKTG